MLGCFRPGVSKPPAKISDIFVYIYANICSDAVVEITIFEEVASVILNDSLQDLKLSL